MKENLMTSCEVSTPSLFSLFKVISKDKFVWYTKNFHALTQPLFKLLLSYCITLIEHLHYSVDIHWNRVFLTVNLKESIEVWFKKDFSSSGVDNKVFLPQITDLLSNTELFLSLFIELRWYDLAKLNEDDTTRLERFKTKMKMRTEFCIFLFFEIWFSKRKK